MKWTWALVAICMLTTPAWAQAGGDRLAAMDLNGDGQITRTEAEQARSAMFTRLDANRDGVLNEAERNAAGQRAQGLARADANGDGAVSRAEFTGQPMRLFDRLDADDNGTLSADEIAAAQSRLNRRG